ncbi:hypothetical protein KAX14_05480 [Candidatus Bipolaricaulota bacterium]|nr:hypothetical protein [Candidatus Bipolaricaulota bacterium]
MPHIILEGLPAAGKTETMQMLARFYPEQIEVFPEIVKQVATKENIHILSERERLTEAVIAELPYRRAQLENVVQQGKICLEESHMGVHLAYSKALNDRSFICAYGKANLSLPRPDLYLRLAIPVDVSMRRQKARKTPQFEVDRPTLKQMLIHLQEWHIAQGSNLRIVNADSSPSTFLAQVEAILPLRYTSKSPTTKETFDTLLLLGRPASGKSEFIEFMNKCPVERLAERYHISPFHVIDDFPILWEKCEEDDLWEHLGRKRLYSQPINGNYYVTDDGLWPFLIGKINERARSLLSKTTSSNETIMIEFSRGKRHGYSEALGCLSPQLLSRAAILYVQVPFSESLRRNIARYNEKKSSGILTHSVPTKEMKRTYKEDDWPDIARAPRGMLIVNGITIPYVTMNNEPELTDIDALDSRYREALEQLYALYLRRSCVYE